MPELVGAANESFDGCYRKLADEARRRGVGAAVSWAAVSAGVDRGRDIIRTVAPSAAFSSTIG